MRVVAFALLAFLVPGPSARAADEIDQAKLVGRWEAVKGGLPTGSTLEFARDGKLKLTVKLKERSIIFAGSYKINGDTFAAVTTQGAKEKSEDHTVKTLTDDKLVIVGETGREDEFRRKKK